MRQTVALLACIALVVGTAIGWHLEDKRLVTKENQAAMQESEDDCAMSAAISIAAIKLIRSSDNQKAVQLLSEPIAQYYYLYATHSGTNEDRLKLLHQINLLVSTNKIVANEITNQMIHFEFHGRLPAY